MNKKVKITGIISCSAIITFTLSFLILIFLFPPADFASTDQYLSSFTISNLLPVVPSFLLVLANVPLFASIYFLTFEDRKIFSFIGLLFGISYTICSGINYHTQLTTVPRSIATGQTDTLNIFLLQNPSSFSMSVDSFGYLCLSLAFLFFASVFNNRSLESWIKSLFVIYGIAGILGALGYILHNSFLSNFILLSAIPYLISVVLLLIYFSKSGVDKHGID